MTHNINDNSSALTNVHSVPISTHPTASVSHAQTYYYNGLDGDAGWYIVAPSGTPIRLAGSDEVVTSAFSNAVDPTVAENVAAGYPLGSMWVNTTESKIWVYASNPSTANWVEVADVESGSFLPDIHTATDDPEATDNADNGFPIGRMWLNTTDNTLWLHRDHDNYSDGAFWVRVPGVRLGNSDPNAYFDEYGGWKRGDVYINTNTNVIWDCLWPYPANAQWRPRNILKNNFAAMVDPTVDDDELDTLEVGSHWLNRATGDLFVCKDQTVGASVWMQVNGPRYSDAATSTPPTLSELQTAFPSNDAIPFYEVYLNVGGAGTDYYLCVWDGTVWAYTALTLAA